MFFNHQVYFIAIIEEVMYLFIVEFLIFANQVIIIIIIAIIKDPFTKINYLREVAIVIVINFMLAKFMKIKFQMVMLFIPIFINWIKIKHFKVIIVKVIIKFIIVKVMIKFIIIN